MLPKSHSLRKILKNNGEFVSVLASSSHSANPCIKPESLTSSVIDGLILNALLDENYSKVICLRLGVENKRSVSDEILASIDPIKFIAIKANTNSSLLQNTSRISMLIDSAIIEMHQLPMRSDVILFVMSYHEASIHIATKGEIFLKQLSSLGLACVVLDLSSPGVICSSVLHSVQRLSDVILTIRDLYSTNSSKFNDGNMVVGEMCLLYRGKVGRLSESSELLTIGPRVVQTVSRTVIVVPNIVMPIANNHIDSNDILPDKHRERDMMPNSSRLPNLIIFNQSDPDFDADADEDEYLDDDLDL